MKKTALCLALLGLLALGGSAFAEIGTADDVPAATLLLPYFECALGPDLVPVANGDTTLFSINNASATGQLAHVTLWTDESVPTLDFDVHMVTCARTAVAEALLIENRVVSPLATGTRSGPSAHSK